MKLASALLAFGLGAASLGLATPAAAAVYVRVAPPAPRVEVIPHARHGYVWIGGYWRWSGHRYVWVGGRYVAERHGYVWVEPRWEEGHGRWHHVPGYWARR